MLISDKGVSCVDAAGNTKGGHYVMIVTKEKLKEALMIAVKYPHGLVGTRRLDYLLSYFQGGGYMAHVLPYPPPADISMYSWGSDYDIQKWLLLRESASIKKAASIHAWSLVKRCYGIRHLVFDQLQIMLEEIEFSDSKEYNLEDTVARHVYKIYSLYKYGNDREEEFTFPPNPKVSADYYPVSENIRGIMGEVKYDYTSIIPIITRMINELYDDLWIYLHYERHFMCVKFLYHTPKEGWLEYTSLNQQQDYYSNLVILHAYASLIQKEEHKNHIITMRKANNEIIIDSLEVEEIGGAITFENHAGNDISKVDGNSFAESYSRWLADKVG